MKPFDQDLGRQTSGGEPAVAKRRLGSGGQAIVITDQSGDILWVNAAFTALTGYTAGKSSERTRAS